MNAEQLTRILEAYRSGEADLAGSLDALKHFPSADLGFAQLDRHRQLRTGYPEVIYCAGKTGDQVAAILRHLLDQPGAILATRAGPEHFAAAAAVSPDLLCDGVSRTIRRLATDTGTPDPARADHYIAVVCAGTSDIPVAEEAAVTAETFGNRVERIYDVGVAGLHRLLHRLELIQGARAIVAVAGMEGALPSVLGGLVERPVIAVPTSIGYGANFGGLSALLAMLNSCAAGVSVVNIDNGFGGGYAASVINRLKGC